LQLDADRLTGTQATRRAGRYHTVDLNTAAVDQALQVTARELASVGDKQLVEPFAMAFRIDLEAPGFDALVELAVRRGAGEANPIIALVF
jgi:hypothetical protein